MRSQEDPPTGCPVPDEPVAATAWPELTRVDCIQVLEVCRGDDEPGMTITAAIAADAIHAIWTALSEQLDRYGHDRTEHAEDVLTLRAHAALVERLRPLALAEGHAIVSFSQVELRTCLLELTRYVERVDEEHYHPVNCEHVCRPSTT